MNFDDHVFAALRTERDIARAFGELDEYMTPLELSMLIARQQALPAPVHHRIGNVVKLGPFAGAKPQSFQRMAIHPDVTLYRDPKIATARKKLIIAFCGAQNRLDMPLAAVMQSLPSREVDIAVLRDRGKQHYLNGIVGYASDFYEIVGGLLRDLRPERYREVYSYGTSMGAFAAVRFSLLSPVRRAVAMGGSFPGYVRRLVDGRPVPGFDPLCDCVASDAKTEIVAVYGERFEIDQRNTEWLARICSVRQIAVPQASIHNVAHVLARSGRLPGFFAAMFELEGSAGGDSYAWLGLPRPSALPIVSAA